MFNEIGGLKNYWHIIALSKDLPEKQSIKRKIYNVGLLIWKDAKGDIFAVVDSCKHKKSPLFVESFSTNEVVCPYHGWKYSKEGNLIVIPSSPHIDIKKLNCSLQAFKVQDEQGFIWINLNPNPKSKIELSSFLLKHEIIENWGSNILSTPFETSDELLIENFMDSTHTPFIHKGLIRGHGEKVKYKVNLSSTNHGVIAKYSETNEEVGLGLNLLLGKNLKVKHTDEFLFPNFVKVDYYINGKHHFNAFIACTPTSNGKTQAFIRLSYNFRGFNPVIKLIIPFLAKKVIRQDQDITKLQYDNQRFNNEEKELLIDCDIMHNKVKMIRRAIINDAPIHKFSTDFKLSL